eukprot:3480048-Pleurochrysis_carterae.AAC.2
MSSLQRLRRCLLRGELRADNTLKRRVLAEHLDDASLLVKHGSVQLEAVLDDSLADDVRLQQLLDGVEG